MQTLPSTLTASEARINLYDMLNEVKTYLRRFVITHKGKPQAIIMPIEDVESWDETLGILSNKKLLADIRQSEKDKKAGLVYPLRQVIKELKLNERRTNPKG